MKYQTVGANIISMTRVFGIWLEAGVGQTTGMDLSYCLFLSLWKAYIYLAGGKSREFRGRTVVMVLCAEKSLENRRQILREHCHRLQKLIGWWFYRYNFDSSKDKPIRIKMTN